jgi:N4-(beta-N-acetylglucosaminyl)-L-asparaginase
MSVNLLLFQILVIFINMDLIHSFDIVQSKSKVLTPTAVATWNFGRIAVEKASQILIENGTSIDAVEAGIRAVELDNQENYFVGVGGLPNAMGEMELDAAMMDHDSNYGAVMAIRDIKTPISVARAVMEKCFHNILCGDGALDFALNHGFVRETDVLTEESRNNWLEWINNKKSMDCHDTVGLICMDSDGRICAGTSTSGYAFKHRGRVGDSPVVGSGLYCDGEAGGIHYYD